MGLKIGLLDFANFTEHIIPLIMDADRLGFSRYWLTEHLPQPSPILMTGLAAGTTDHIRVGTAGVLLRYYNPVQLSHDFNLLEWAYPGRIDAGFCGGTASGEIGANYLDGRSRDYLMNGYPDKVRALVSHLRVDMKGFPSSEWRETPPHRPDIWFHGTGMRSAKMAAELGLCMGYSLFHNFSMDSTESLEYYRDHFKPNDFLASPQAVVAVAGVCHPDEKVARKTADHYASRNKFIVPTLVGSPQRIVDDMHELASRYGVEELVYLDISQEFQSRQQSMHLIASAAALEPPSPIEE